MALGNPITLTDNVAAKVISVTATSGQTVFTVTGGYRINQLGVYRNGVRLVESNDYNASDGSSVTLYSAATADDILAFQIFDDFRVSDAIVSLASTQTISGNLNVTGAYYGDGSNLTGIDATSLKDGDGTVRVQANTSGAVVSGVITATTGDYSGNVTIGGTLTYEDVTNIDSVGLITARSGIRVTDGGVKVTAGGIDISAGGIKVTGIATATTVSASGTITANAFYGDGSNLEGVVSGIELEQAGSSVGTSLTAINFASGATLTTGSGGISTISILASISTAASSPSSNAIVTINLGSAQHHQLTLSAGITTITTTGGSFGNSHSLALIQPSSGIATVGFSTYFLWPSGSTPIMSKGGSKIDLVSFIVKNQPAAGIGTQLLASAGLNYS